MNYKENYITKEGKKIPVRNEVTNRYLLPEHADRIEAGFKAVKDLCFFSVRPAGVDTLQKLKMGAAPKPHSILEKSIKDTEYDFLYDLWYNPADQKDARQNIKNALCGLVPFRKDFTFKYNEHGVEKTECVRIIRGLFLSKAGESHFSRLGGKFKTSVDKNKRAYAEFNAETGLFEWVQSILDTCRTPDEYAKWFVTGDYDLHDLVQHNGSYTNTYISGSGDEATALTQLSDVFAGRKPAGITTKFDPEEKSVIQHGAQYNYIAHTFSKEKNTEIVKKVADLSLEIALYDGKTWTIIENDPTRKDAYEKQSKELKSYYYDHYNAILKWDWDKCNPKADDYLRAIENKTLMDYIRTTIRK